MTKSDIQIYPEYYNKYMDLTENADYIKVLKDSLLTLENAPVSQWKTLGDSVYAKGKWTIKELLQHLIDTERIFAYRTLVFARKDTQITPSFDQDEYVNHADVSHRTIEDLLEEYKTVKRSLIALFQSFTSDMMNNVGTMASGKISVLAFPYIIAGHQKWHFNILEERYMPLLNS